MADNLKVENNNEKSFVTKAADFIVKNKLALIVASAAVVLAVVLIVVISSVSTSSKDKAFVRVYNLEERFTSFVSKSDSDADYKDTFESLTKDLEKEVKKGDYPSVKAAFLLAEAYYSQEDYSAAYDWYMKAFNLNSKIYLSSMCLVNAAVCKENTGDVNAALDLYKKASEYEEVKPQAMFNVGRIYYQQNQKDLAKATWQALVDLKASSEYKALAQNILTTF